MVCSFSLKFQACCERALRLQRKRIISLAKTSNWQGRAKDMNYQVPDVAFKKKLITRTNPAPVSHYLDLAAWMRHRPMAYACKGSQATSPRHHQHHTMSSACRVASAWQAASASTPQKPHPTRHLPTSQFNQPSL